MSVAFPFAPVRPDTPGGAEQVLLTLDRALVSARHGSIVVAQEGSIVNGSIVPLPKTEGLIDEKIRALAHEACREAIDRALDETDIDLVHMHGLDFHEYMPQKGIPLLVTLHLPLPWYPEKALRSGRQNTYFNCVSRSQAMSVPMCAGPFMVIENGVETDGYSRKDRGQYALSLGRICPEKGFHLAMDAARMAGVPFILAGAVFRYEAHERYFQKAIVPRLGTDSRFVGQAGPETKKKLFSEALCLVAPSLVPETSSIAAMEALASGTPVVAFASGALAEIVEHGKTGFLVKDIHEMALAISECRRLDQIECKKAAAGRFSSRSMIEKYFDVYSRMTARE